MPLYEYKCRQCGHKFEELVGSSTATDEMPCPACGAAAGERQFSTFSSNLRRGSFSSCTSGSCSTCAPSSRFR